MSKYDIAIVGAGPAGSSTAIRLAKAGFKVLLIEQKKFPRQKLCGEFISPECLTHFDELEVSPAMLSAGGVDIEKTVFYSRGGRSIEIDSEWFGMGKPALGLSRAEMDLRLLERARASGVEVREETNLAGLLQHEGKVCGIRTRDRTGSEAEVGATITIDATGRVRAAARRVDGRTARRGHPPSHVAFKAHLSGAEIAGNACEIFGYSGGYGGCSNIENGLANLCFIAAAADVRNCGSDPERVMREVVFGNKRAAKVLASAKAETEWLAVPIEKFGRGDAVPAPGLIAVGDSAAFIDPFTGSGMLMALESGKLAASAVIEHLPNGVEMISRAYAANYSAYFDRRLRFSGSLRSAAFVPLFADATILVLSMSSALQRYVARATRRSGDAISKV